VNTSSRFVGPKKKVKGLRFAAAVVVRATFLAESGPHQSLLARTRATQNPSPIPHPSFTHFFLPNFATMMLSSLLRRSGRQSAQLLLRPRPAQSVNRGALSHAVLRTFATNPKQEEETTKEHATTDEPHESLRDTVNRMSGKTETDKENPTDDLLRRASETWANLSEEIGKTWKELVDSGKRKDINKKIHPVATPEGDRPYDGPVDIMVIDPSENLTAWERMQKRLTEAPIIQDMLSRSEKLYEESGAKKVKERVDEIREDAQEAWDTSQNPWVYRISSVYDTLTAESAESVAVRELRQLDPEFTLEDWRQDVVEHTLPQIMTWFLDGRINQLKPWLGESVFKRIAAEMKAREQEGVQIDTHMLGIMNSEILAVEVSPYQCRSYPF